MLFISQTLDEMDHLNRNEKKKKSSILLRKFNFVGNKRVFRLKQNFSCFTRAHYSIKY